MHHQKPGHIVLMRDACCATEPIYSRFALIAELNICGCSTVTWSDVFYYSLIISFTFYLGCLLCIFNQLNAWKSTEHAALCKHVCAFQKQKWNSPKYVYDLQESVSCLATPNFKEKQVLVLILIRSLCLRMLMELFNKLNRSYTYMTIFTSDQHDLISNR